jgi:co-chaperonin GroES (HSP10)
MKFRPLHDRVVIRRLNAEKKTAGGIVIPDTVQEKPMEGEVVAIGPGARNEQLRCAYRPGTRPATTDIGGFPNDH